MHVWWNAHHTDGTWWYLLFAVTQPYVFPLSKLTLSAHQECSTRCSQRMVAATLEGWRGSKRRRRRRRRTVWREGFYYTRVDITPWKCANNTKSRRTGGSDNIANTMTRKRRGRRKRAFPPVGSLYLPCLQLGKSDKYFPSRRHVSREKRARISLPFYQFVETKRERESDRFYTPL